MSYIQDMRPENWMDDVFGNRSKIRVLRLLFKDPERMWTEREIAKALGMSPNSINVAASQLRGAGLLDVHRLGRSHSVRLRRDLRITQTLGAMFQREEALLQEWIQAIMGVVPASAACSLYGSVARHTSRRDSDVDLVIVARSRGEAEEIASKVREASAAVMPLPLDIVSLDRKTARGRRRSPLLRNILSEGRPLSKTRIQDVL